MLNMAPLIEDYLARGGVIQRVPQFQPAPVPPPVLHGRALRRWKRAVGNRMRIMVILGAADRPLGLKQLIAAAGLSEGAAEHAIKYLLAKRRVVIVARLQSRARLFGLAP